MASDRNVLGVGFAALGAFFLVWGAALPFPEHSFAAPLGLGDGPLRTLLVTAALAIWMLVLASHESVTVLRDTRFTWAAAFLLGALTFTYFLLFSRGAAGLRSAIGGGTWAVLVGSGLVVAGAATGLLDGQEKATGEDYTATGPHRRLVLGSGALIGATVVGGIGSVFVGTHSEHVTVSNGSTAERTVRVRVSGTLRDSEHTLALEAGERERVRVSFPDGEYTLVVTHESGARERYDVPSGHGYSTPRISVREDGVSITQAAY